MVCDSPQLNGSRKVFQSSCSRSEIPASMGQGCSTSMGDAERDRVIERLSNILHSGRDLIPETQASHMILGTMPGTQQLSLRLENLVLRGLNLYDYGASALGHALQHFRLLKLLDVRDCGLIPGVLELFAEGIAKGVPTGLHTLWIGGNWFDSGEECNQALCRGLRRGRAHSLTSLDLANSIMPQGGHYIAEMLVALRPPLTELDLSDSRLGGPGARYLLDAMSRAPLTSLRMLDLFACHIGPRGAEAIGAILAASEVPISDLSLADNAIQDQGLAALTTALLSSPAFAQAGYSLRLASVLKLNCKYLVLT